MWNVSPYLPLAVFPVTVHLLPNPVISWWAVKQGRTPMPPDVAKRAESAGRWCLLAVEGMVITTVLALMWHGSVPVSKVGLHSTNLKVQLVLGFLAGLGWLVLVGILNALPPVRVGKQINLRLHYLERGSICFWVPLFLLGAFAEELWRAYCLRTLIDAGHSMAEAVLLTSVAFGIGHLDSRVGRAVGALILGIAAGAMFIWTKSLVAVYVAHLIVNLGMLFRVRS